MTDDGSSDTTHSTSLSHRQTRAPPNHRRLRDLDGPSLTVGVMLGMILGVFITSAFLAGVIALVWRTLGRHSPRRERTRPGWRGALGCGAPLANYPDGPQPDSLQHMSDNDSPNADADANTDQPFDRAADEHPTDVQAGRADCLRVSEVPIYGEETTEAIGGTDEDPYEVTATVQVPDGDRPLSDLIQRLRTATVEHVEEQPEGDYPFRQTPGALAKQGERAAFRQALNRLVDLASGAGLEMEAISQETRLFTHRIRLTEDVTGPSATPADGEPPVLGTNEESRERTGVFRRGSPIDGEDDPDGETDEWPGKWRASDQQNDSPEADGPPAFRPLHDSAGQDDNRGVEKPPSAATDGGSGTGGPSRKPLSEVPAEDVPSVAIQGDGPRVATVVPVNVLRSENPPLLVAICSAVAKAHGVDPAWLPRGVEKWADGLMPAAIVDRTTAVEDDATATAAFRHVAGLCHSVVQDTEPTEVYYIGAGEPPAGLPVRDESAGPTNDPSEGDNE